MTVEGLNFEKPRGRGRAPKPVSAEYVRDLVPADFALLRTEQGIQPPARVKIRDRHHALARCLATGMKTSEASAITGYTPSTISILKGDPGFKQLLAEYRNAENAAMASFVERATTLTTTAINELQDRLEEAPEEFSPATLIEIGKVFADRIGYAPAAQQVQVNIHTEGLAQRLAAAKERMANRTLPSNITDAEFEALPDGE